MQKEIEKKYELTSHDYEIIKNKCHFISEEELKDYYLDTPEYILGKNNYFLRLRNGKYELKILQVHGEVHESEEYEDEEIINQKLKKFNISLDDPEGVCFVHTKREKFEYDFNGLKFSIDIDRYQYDARYEIELVIDLDKEINGEEKIESLRNMLGLNAEGGRKSFKVETCAMYQNIGYYEVISDY